MPRDPVCGMPISKRDAEFEISLRGKTYYFDSEYCRDTFLTGSRVAYFSMEVGLANAMHSYSGGLGVLAGDMIRSSADLKIPMVAVTLISKKGYIKQELSDDGTQMEKSDDWEPSEFMEELPGLVNVKIENRDVATKAWLYDYTSPTGGLVSILFLDTDLEENEEQDRAITDYLYGGDAGYRLKQEAILGIGGVRILQESGFTISKY
ncbi:MAG: YHS domain-containing protein, partial [Theionarchaea archaeon]|nr:YHS domain-containing protein [Theionarchaea archaeon]